MGFLMLLFCILDIGFIFATFKLLEFTESIVFREEPYTDDATVREASEEIGRTSAPKELLS